MAVFIGVIAPMIMSHLSGGWTRKYTSPGFQTSSIPRLDGKVAVVTGANTGIGLETAKELARKGARVYALARSESKGQAAVQEINAAISHDSGSQKVVFMKMDLASLKSIKSFEEAWMASGSKIDILVLNAGIMKSPGAVFVGQQFNYGYETTAEGFESHIGVNHIGHFYLTTLMKPFMKKGTRVISVSSAAEAAAPVGGIRFDLWRTSEMPDEYEDGAMYGQSKLANIMFARELAKRWKDDGVEAYSCHPGIIATDLGRYMYEEMQKQAETNGFGAALANMLLGVVFGNAVFSRADGALTQLHLAVAHGVENGGYYVPIGQLATPVHPEGQNMTLQKQLWDKTEEAIERAIGR